MPNNINLISEILSPGEQYESLKFCRFYCLINTFIINRMLTLPLLNK